MGGKVEKIGLNRSENGKGDFIIIHARRCAVSFHLESLDALEVICSSFLEKKKQARSSPHIDCRTVTFGITVFDCSQVLGSSHYPVTLNKKLMNLDFYYLKVATPHYHF